MATSVKTVLIVESEQEIRDRIASWLEDAAVEVLVCPGPSAPDYTCVAGRGGSCPLAHGADLVVLDLWLAGDHELQGLSGVDLLGYYTSMDKPVIALSHGCEATQLFVEEGVLEMPWPPERKEFVETVRMVLRPPGKARSKVDRIDSTAL